MLIFWVLAIKLFTDNAVPGWASILVPLLFIGSVQLLSIGVIGEYLGKLYEEVKARPRYHIDQRIEGSAQVEQCPRKGPQGDSTQRGMSD